MLVSARKQKKQWVIHQPDKRSAQLAKSLKISPLLAQVLINREISDVQAGAAVIKESVPIPKWTALPE